jgi:acetyltransferase
LNTGDKFQRLFHPEAVAVIGASATPGKWGFGILHNLIQGQFPGPIYPINLKEKEILGRRAYPSLAEAPGPVDLAVIVVPPDKVISAVQDCGRKGVGAVVIITAGFGEVGPEEMRLQQELARVIQATGMAAIGPNCQGVMSAQAKLFAQFLWIFPAAGKISIVSQSGNVGGSLMGRGLAFGIGFSKFISSGNEAVTKCHELIAYLGDDPETDVIMSYLEGVSEGQAFFQALRRVCPKKPVVILKGGVTAAGSKACASHTGVLAGESNLFFSACRQAGATIVDNLDDLFYTAVTFASQPLPKTNRVGIITWGGGWGVLAADACVQEGLAVAPLPPGVIEQLNEFLPSRWSHNNPVDLAAGGGPGVLSRTLEIMARDPAFDGVVQLGIGISSFLRFMTASSFYFSHPDRVKVREMLMKAAVEADIKFPEKVMRLSRETGKPILSASDTASTPGEDNVVMQTFRQEGKIIYPTPFHAARCLGHLARYARFRQMQGI